MARVTIPAQDVQLMLPNGTINPDWYPVFKFLESLQPLSDLPAVPSFSEAPLTPGNSTATITASPTYNDSLNSSAGTDNGNGNLGYGTGSSPFDSYTKVANALNRINTNIANLDVAVDGAGGLNGRVTALENKLNDVISDLDTRFP